jgi:lauroyl/myristoyl acyltransferase
MATTPITPTSAHAAQPARTPGTRARRIGPWRDCLNLLEWLRYFEDRLLIVAAARVLPLRWGLALASALGTVDALLPTRAARATRAEIAALHGGRARLRDVAARLAFPRKDLLYLARFACGRDALADWRIERSGVDELEQLLARGQSVVLTTGHFSMAGSTLRRVVLPRRSMSLVGEPVPWQLSPFRLRLRLGTGVRMRARARALQVLPPEVGASPRQYVADRWTRGHDPDAVPARLPAVQEAMLAHLAEPGALLVVAVDAAWPKPHALRRPFAGLGEQPFATGAARTARLAQCPIVPYVITLGQTPRTVHIEFGAAIAPAAADDAAADARVTNRLLDWLEVRIGRNAEQYLALVGWDRHWDTTTEQWRGEPAALPTRVAEAVSGDAGS